MRFLLAFLVAIVPAFAFVPQRFQPRMLPIRSTVQHSNNEPKGNGLRELLAQILEAVPLAIRTPAKEMDMSKIVKNPPGFYKPSTASKFRKAQKSESAWKVQDIISEFNSKYGVVIDKKSQSDKLKEKALAKAVSDEKAALIELLDELESMELTEAVEMHLEGNPLLSTEKYIADASGVAFSPLTKKVDPTNVVRNMKGFTKPMSLREIKKKLHSDPEYFHH